MAQTIVTTQFDREDASYLPGPSGLQNFYPKNETDMGKMNAWCQYAITAADRHRYPYRVRWERYNRLYRSYVKRKTGDWHSRVFYPICFWVVEAIAPRLVANLPQAVVLPVGPDDVQGAEEMEELLKWATSNADVFLQLVIAVKSALKYGTGILKTFQRQDIRYKRVSVSTQNPQTAMQDLPVMDPENPGQFLYDQNGNPLFESREVIMGNQTQTQWKTQPYVAYDGPATEAIDLFNFWVAPEAEDIQGARYIIHRTYREMSYVQRRIQEGVFEEPKGGFVWESNMGDVSEEPNLYRQSQIGLGSAAHDDFTRRPVELLEFWTDDGRVITWANREVILRAHENPFDHGQKPFVRVVDHLAEHEFYGIGEIEPLEGLQDLMNAIVNQRNDNVRLVMNAMFAVNTKYVEDLRDLTPRPGGIIRVKEDLPVNEVIQRMGTGDVTPSAYQEAAYIESVIEKVSAVTAYQLGTDSPSMNDTATGVQLITEAGATRFGLKTKLMEQMGLKDMFRQFGGLLQQFTTEPKAIRILGPDGQAIFRDFTPEALAGSFDYDIESESAAQTEASRRSDALTLLQVLGAYAPQAIPKLSEDVLQAFGRRDINEYLQQQQAMNPMDQMAQQSQPGQPGPQDQSGGAQPPMPGLQGPGVPAGLPPFQSPQPVAPMQRFNTPEAPALPLQILQRGPAR